MAVELHLDLEVDLEVADSSMMRMCAAVVVLRVVDIVIPRRGTGGGRPSRTLF